jgi:broad specificity phosphatase PhoE
MTRIALMRHGETGRNLRGLFQGQADEPLHETGIERFREMAEATRDLPLSAIYCSGFRRAVACARILGERRSMAPRIDPSLGERDLGLLDGQSKATVAAEHPGIQADLMRLSFRPPQGESAEECIERFRRAFERILADQPQAGSVIVVSHGGAAALFSHHVLGVPLDRCFLDHGAFHLIDASQSGDYRVADAGIPGSSLRENLL